MSLIFLTWKAFLLTQVKRSHFERELILIDGQPVAALSKSAEGFSRLLTQYKQSGSAIQCLLWSRNFMIWGGRG
jgi:hypothetical protein